MTQVFELAAFTVRDGHEQALLDERPAMMAAMRRETSWHLIDHIGMQTR